jgi:membrane protein insertase Oxa1/YidC/SpoIIIJ
MVPQESNKKKEEGFQEHFAKSMRIQLLYVLPIIITFSAAVLPSALGLYWFVSNSASYALDVYMKRKLSHLKEPEMRGEAYDVLKEVEEDIVAVEKKLEKK